MPSLGLRQVLTRIGRGSLSYVPGSDIGSMCRMLASVGLCFLLVSCGSFKIGEPYDQVIDDQLNAFQKSSAAFIKSMQINEGTAKGAYHSDEAKAYYAAAAADLSNLRLRAELLSSRECPTAKAANLIGDLGTSTQIGEAEAQVGGNGSSPDEALNASGNCIAITIRNVQLAEENLEADHIDAGRLSPRVAQLDGQEIDAAVRVALTAIRSKKY